MAHFFVKCIFYMECICLCVYLHVYVGNNNTSESVCVLLFVKIELFVFFNLYSLKVPLNMGIHIQMSLSSKCLKITVRCPYLATIQTFR